MSHEADHAARSLREVDELTTRARRASRSLATGLPLIGWGAAWTVGLGALDLLHGLVRILVPVLAWVGGMLLSWAPRRATIRTGTETRMRWAWVVVLVSSPVFVAVARPATFEHGVLLLGCLWGLAMCLYAIATNDPVLAAAAGFGIVMAGVVSVLDLPGSLLWYGACAGLPLLAIGAHRVVGEKNRA